MLKSYVHIEATYLSGMCSHEGSMFTIGESVYMKEICSHDKVHNKQVCSHEGNISR